MDDPLYTIPFIKRIISERKNDIVGLTVIRGGRFKIGKDRSKPAYLLSLLLIMGLPFFIENTYKTLVFRVKNILSQFRITNSGSIFHYAENLGIKTYVTTDPNNENFLSVLRLNKPDIIINQSQSILKAPLLNIPAIGTLNRHNALLPRNRGRLSPFWILYKQETETGVSIHFVDEGIDSGAIIVQESFPVLANDTFKSIVKKNYQIAPGLMLKALDLLENGFNEFLENDRSKATYNKVPTLYEAFDYRRKRICRFY